MLAALACLAGAQQPAAGHTTAPPGQGGEITETELSRMLVGKFLYLRGGYLDNSLSFNDHGLLMGHSPQGSYALSIIQIDKVSLTKHKVKLEGVRYGLHFLNASPSSGSTFAADRVRITPRKHHVKITIDRIVPAKPRRKKRQPKAAGNAPHSESGPSTATINSPAYAAMVLKQAIGNVFAFKLDARMKAAMPAFWKRYYNAAGAKTGLQTAEPAVLRQDQVDRKARLLAGIHAPSNAYAQACGIAGLALYHAIISADGKPEDISVVRPIGFGLDESAVAAIRKGRFEPAMKDGKPVPVQLDLMVEFRIYSRRTSSATSFGATQPRSSRPSKPYTK